MNASSNPYDNHFKQIYHANKKYVILSVSVVMYFFWMSDRSSSFIFKVNKHYSFLTFLLFFAAICVANLCFGAWIPVKSAGFLNREQTSEWKGWMQVFILLYHITGASVHVPVYMHIRLLVGAYLFQTGYGHMCYALAKADYSFLRIQKVMFRLLFLTVTLCWVMNRPIQFYYFIPLSAYYFLLYFGWLAIPVLQPPKATEENMMSSLRLATLKLVTFMRFGIKKDYV